LVLVPIAATEAPELAAAAEYDFSGVSPIVEGFIDERGLNGAALIVVDRDDGTIHDEYWGDFRPDRVSLIASSSKMITAGVLLRLHDDGLLDIDAPVAAVADWGPATRRSRPPSCCRTALDSSAYCPTRAPSAVRHRRTGGAAPWPSTGSHVAKRSNVARSRR
jgi:Beta-lactamase